MEKMLYLSHQN